MPEVDCSEFLPTFLKRLADPSIKTVMLCGCGGGFDFVHSLVLYPELRRLGKSVIVGSYSFGDPNRITGDAEVVFDESGCLVKRVSAVSTPAPYYGPEVHACSFLDSKYPAFAPHFIYAYYARAFTVPLLTTLYSEFIGTHAIDAVVLVDGGSDSLMVGDEEGLGDPIEDAVSVTTVASLNLKAKILICIGLGADRFNHVSDAASLRAIAELTKMDGFIGSASIERSSDSFAFYRGCLEHIYERQEFRSVLAGIIASSADGCFASDFIPALLPKRVNEGEIYLWPLMAMLWAFDVDKVAERSLIADWIRKCQTASECEEAIEAGRRRLGPRLRDVENLPPHEEMRC